MSYLLDQCKYSPGVCNTSMNTNISVSAQGRPQPVDVDIVIPAYNEQRTLGNNIEALLDFLTHQNRDCPVWTVVIADNASTDATWLVARELCARHPDLVRAVHLDVKGRGLALATTWSHSLAKVVAYMDVDLSTDLNDIGALINPLLDGSTDVTFGSRLSPQSEVVRSTKREFISRAYNHMLHWYLDARFHDAQCGFKALTAQAAAQLLPRVSDNAWFFDTELLLLAQYGNLRVREIPVHWVEDQNSTVDILDTAWKDIQGMHRMKRELGIGSSDYERRHLSSRYSPLGWDAQGQRILPGSLLTMTKHEARP